MSLHVLMIEDNKQNCYLQRFLLEKSSHTVIEAHDGFAGIQLAQQSHPDVILLDIQLPTMHGYDVAVALRQMPALADTPIIAVTSYAMPGDRERALACGCNDYIEKPIDPDNFVSEVERIVQELRT